MKVMLLGKERKEWGRAAGCAEIAMDPTLLEATQSLEAATDDAEAAQNARMEARVLEIHTCLPGAIVSYDAAKKTAVCKPGIKKVFREKGPVDLPQLVDCLVSFPSGGGFTLAFGIKKGDECELRFSERALDFWWQNGGVQLPAEYRTHDLSDAICQVGISSLPNVPTGLPTDGVELRANDGSSKVRLDSDGSITVTSKPGKDVTMSAGANTNVNGQLVNLNAPPGATPPMNGALNGSCPCPYTGLTHMAGASLTVMVGGTP